MAHRSSDAPVLGIVPARARGNGLVGKNMRLLAGKPLIAHTLEAALESGAIDRLVLSSEGDEILRWCEMHGYETIRRPEELAGDDATVGEVARHAADECDWTGIVAVLEPTSPLRSGASIARAVERFRRDEPDSLSTVIREPHFFWFDESDDIDEPRPLFRERANRTAGRRGVLKETGAIQLVRAEVLRVTASIAGERHALMELPLDESLSVSTFDDLTAIRRRLERGTVVFRMRSSKRVGAGHLYHCLQLAEELTDQSLRFLLVGCDRFVTDALDERGYDWVEETDLTSDLERLKQPGAANVLVNDVLDTEEREVLLARASGYTVVNIEDLGAGARFADWVVNALYSANMNGHGHHVASGAPWATLRHEFHGLPLKEPREVPQRVLVTFGGTDPAGLSARFGAALGNSDLGVDVHVVLGLGASDIELPDGVTVKRSIRSMAAEMMAADVVVTSAGRTVYEAAATGTPVVAVAQNAREATHAHLGADTGVIFLGIGTLVDDAHLVATVRRLLNDRTIRGELGARLRRSIDAKGAERIAHRIRGLMRGL